MYIYDISSLRVNEMQSLTELRVTCAITGGWRKPTRHLSAVVSIVRNNGIKKMAAVDS